MTSLGKASEAERKSGLVSRVMRHKRITLWYVNAGWSLA